MTSRQIQILVGLLIVCVIGVGLVFLADSNRRKLAERMTTEKAAQTETAGAAAKSESEQQQAEAEKPEAASGGSADKPSFDIARFEPSGDGVLAGLAKPGAEVELLANGEPISSTTANEVGEWVIVLEKPLRAGSHDLAVRAAVSENEKVLSDEFIAVVVPDTPEGEVLVVASKPGQASEILSRPSGDTSAAASATTGKPAEMASAKDTAAVTEQASAAGSDAGQSVTTADGGSGETQVAAVNDTDAMQPSSSAATAARAGASAGQSAGEVVVAAKSEPGAESTVMAEQMPVDADDKPTEALAEAASTGRAQDTAKTMDMAAASTDEQTSGTMTETGAAVAGSAESTAAASVAASGAAATAESGTTAMSTEQAEASGTDTEMAAKTETEPVVDKPKRDHRLALEAVETEGRMVYAAGTGKPGTVVRVYADDTYVGETSTDDNGRWLLETEAEIAAGNVVVRADELQEGSSEVARRAEVPFFKQADAIALLPTTAKAGAGAGEDASAGELLAPRSVIIRSGDNLWTISRRTYGRGIRYTTIYKANGDQIRNPHMIFPGQVFVLPEGDAAWTQ